MLELQIRASVVKLECFVLLTKPIKIGYYKMDQRIIYVVKTWFYPRNVMKLKFKKNIVR